MRKMRLLLIMSVLMLCGGRMAAQDVADWTPEKELQYLHNRQDSTTWDYQMMAEDLQSVTREFAMRPFPVGIFPVSRYELLGKETFRGLGCGSDYRPYGDRGNHLIQCSFFVRRNAFTARYLGDNQQSEVFFSVVVLSDIPIDTVNYDHYQNYITSRNNPSYVGQGEIQTNQGPIDYIGFLNADRTGYAIVNMRLFDLRHGRIILIAPRKDGSLRSMQVDPERIVSNEELSDYTDEMLKEPSVVAFFNDPGNI